MVFDVWDNSFRNLQVSARADCPACGGHYDFLDGRHATSTTSLCGQNAVQVLPSGQSKISLAELGRRLEKVGNVSRSDFLLNFSADGVEMLVFPDGRAIIKNTHDESLAKGLYARYIGA
jgi:adenylyltransferase/sulfurtransferase